MNLTRLQKLTEEQSKLTQELRESIELNRLYGTENESLIAGAYRLHTGVGRSKYVYITIRKGEEVKVFKVTDTQLESSPLRNINIQRMYKHPYPIRDN